MPIDCIPVGFYSIARSRLALLSRNGTLMSSAGFSLQETRIYFIYLLTDKWILGGMGYSSLDFTAMLGPVSLAIHIARGCGCVAAFYASY